MNRLKRLLLVLVTTYYLNLANIGITADWELPGGGGGGTDAEVTISEDIAIMGVTVGNYNSGDVINKDTTLQQFIKGMVQKQIPPTYSAPTLSINGGGTYEVGYTVTPSITPTLSQKDGGTLTQYIFYHNGNAVIDTNTLVTYHSAPFIVSTTAVTFSARAYYNEGPIKNDNFGNPYPAGHILAGYVNAGSKSYNGQRRYWYDLDEDTNETPTSAYIRALSNTALNAGAGTAFTLNIVAGTKRIIFAYPATIRDVSSIKYVELGNAEVKDTFTLINVDVEGYDGYTAIPYKVYIYIPAIPFGDKATYNVTI